MINRFALQPSRKRYEYENRRKEAPNPSVSISGDDMMLLQLSIYAQLITFSPCRFEPGCDNSQSSLQHHGSFLLHSKMARPHFLHPRLRRAAIRHALLPQHERHP